MKPGPSVSRGFRNRLRLGLASARVRIKGRREPHAFEPLEERFLLAGMVAFPIGDTSHLLPLPVAVTSQLSTQGQDSSATTVLPDGPFIYRDDSYPFKTADGNPPVRVDLVWPQGPDPSDGQLIVSYASGQALYVLPLAEIDAIDAILPIPSGQGVTANLEVNLRITRPDPDSSSTGSYRIAISWTQLTSSTGSTPSTPGNPAPGASGTPATIGPLPVPVSSAITPQTDVTVVLPPTPSTLVATRDLPAPYSSPSPARGDGSPAAAGTSSPVVAPADLGLARVAIIPTAPSTPSAPSSPSSSPSSSASAASATPAFAIPLPAASGASSWSWNAEGGRPAVVGPLPMSGSSPDGGIFAYGQAKGPTDPFRATLTSSHGADPLDGPDALAAATGRRRSRDFAVPVPLEGPALGLPVEGPVDPELTGSPSATGVAFLPAVVPLPEARIGRAPHREPGSRWPILHSRIKPRSTLAALALGSAGFFFGLVAPDCVTGLAAWKEDRPWKRRWAFGDPKQRPGQPREV